MMGFDGIFDVKDFEVAGLPDDVNNVDLHRNLSDVVKPEICLSGVDNVSHLALAYHRRGIDDVGGTGFHFHKNHCAILLHHKVELQFVEAPVGFANGVTLADEEFFNCFLAGFAKFVVFCDVKIVRN